MSSEVRVRQYSVGIHTTFWTDKIIDKHNLESFISEDGFEEKKIKEGVVPKKVICGCMHCGNEYDFTSRNIDEIKLPCFGVDNICTLPESLLYKKLREGRYSDID